MTSSLYVSQHVLQPFYWLRDVCTMKQFLWQDDLVSVAKFIHACLDKMFSCETGLPNDSQASDQPDVAGRDVT